ncbi:MAG: Spo0B domain-containing protein [Microbacteriaceae bacterium]|nr:Spo0B domain-containing protein [Microbacteriaceae bacterium]
MGRLSGPWSVTSRIFAALLAAVVVLGGCLTLLLWLVLRQSADDTAARLSLGVSTTLANDPFLIARVQDADPTVALQPYAMRVVRAAGVDFVTIMSPGGIRFTHPDPRQIGKKFLGTTAEALQGRSITETHVGTLGPSVRAVVPVKRGDKVVAIVSAGVTVNRVQQSVTPRIPLIVGSAIALVLAGTVGAVVTRSFLTRVTGTLRPAELSRMVGYYESVLHSVREGLILADDRRRVVLYNDAAADLLEIAPAARDMEPIAAAQLGLPLTLTALIDSARGVSDELHQAGRRVLLVSQEPAISSGSTGAVGSLTILRDQSEVRELSGELESVRTLSTALRSQAHEYANRLHTVVSLLELGRTPQAIALITEQSTRSQTLADELVGLSGDPVLAALLLTKVTQAGERGVTVRVSVEGDSRGSILTPTEVVSVFGNLLDNAIDAAIAAALDAGSDAVSDADSAAMVSPRIFANGGGETTAPFVTVRLNNARGAYTELTVSDSGTGITPETASRIFLPGFSTKRSGAFGRGYGLAIVREILNKRGGDIALRESGPGGSTFVAHWPISIEVAKTTSAKIESAGPAKPKAYGP